MLETPSSGEILFDGELFFKKYSKELEDQIETIHHQIKSLKKSLSGAKGNRQEYDNTLAQINDATEQLTSLKEIFKKRKTEEKSIKKSLDARDKSNIF